MSKGWWGEEAGKYRKEAGMYGHVEECIMFQTHPPTAHRPSGKALASELFPHSWYCLLCLFKQI